MVLTPSRPPSPSEPAPWDAPLQDAVPALADCPWDAPVTLAVTPTDDPDVAALLSEEKIGPRDGAGRTMVVAMSGGVDSAVTALVMRERGYRVIGMNLRLFSPEDPDHRANPCCGLPALSDARRTSARIGIPFYALDMEHEFAESVIDRFVDEYVQGRTPNPCLECNRHVKFRHLVTKARQLGADGLATGHYARIVRADPDAPAGSDGARHQLLRAVDDRKDQSYVLYTLDQDQLGYIHFPLGNLTKPEVRTIARAFGLPVADKKESQEICFVGDRSYAQFVRERRPDAARPGDIVDGEGQVLGQHDGLLNHTVGQRRGLGIATTQPLYVVGLDTAANRLVVGPKTATAARGLTLDRVSLTGGIPAGGETGIAADVMVRYRGQVAAGKVTVTPDPAGDRYGTATVSFDGAGPVASPGQAAVFYAPGGTEVLGGGTITAVDR
ncbi:MAG TPA: tRNA 2-thiouridine(34) synthase MnmA [Thermomicrobiales bacterium]|nr:tRNA 2-thiouridine(34) synthase MnmA [Thermomicrobiales bacterium]